MRQFDALFFDMDGTLVESTGLMQGAFRQAFLNQGLKVETDVWQASGCTDWEIMDRFLSFFPEFSEAQKEELKEKVAADIKKIIVEHLKEQGLKALPGAPELIKKMVELEIAPGLLTGNMEDIVAPKLAAAGMNKADFPYGGFGDHAPKRVITAQNALASASAYLGYTVAPARSLVIGDTPNDIACARAVGAKVLALPTGKYTAESLLEHDPDFLLKDLTDINAFLEIVG